MTLAIIGGMGPEATLSFLIDLHDEIRCLVKPRVDQDFPSYLVINDPRIPNRTEAVFGRGPSPVATIAGAMHRLRESGASFFAIPCNTTHAWYAMLVSEAAPARIHHIVDAVDHVVGERGWRGRRHGLLATHGSIEARVYQDRLLDGDCLILPTLQELNELIMPGIAAVKASQHDEGRRLLAEAETRLQDRGADVIIHGCTEIPIVLPENEATVCRVSSTRALARYCVKAMKESANMRI